jgi:ubiquinone/menaquinone biosynthesis C-methylase UbiE
LEDAVPAEVHHPIFARLYPRFDAAASRNGGAALRKELLEGATGRALEVGAGHGANFARYPSSVTEVVAIEPEPSLRALAEQAVDSAAMPVIVRPGVGEALPVADATIDVAVVSLVMCSVRDPAQVLAELRRVLRPGGELRFFEHVRATSTGFARFQRATDVIWPHLLGGCHTSRDTEAAILDAGFTLERHRRFLFPDTRFAGPASPCIIGLARAPH